MITVIKTGFQIVTQNIVFQSKTTVEGKKLIIYVMNSSEKLNDNNTHNRQIQQKLCYTC